MNGRAASGEGEGFSHVNHEVCQSLLRTTGDGDGQLGAGHSTALQGEPPLETHLPHLLYDFFLHLQHIQE